MRKSRERAFNPINNPNLCFYVPSAHICIQDNDFQSSNIENENPIPLLSCQKKIKMNQLSRFPLRDVIKLNLLSVSYTPHTPLSTIITTHQTTYSEHFITQQL